MISHIYLRARQGNKDFKTVCCFPWRKMRDSFNIMALGGCIHWKIFQIGTLLTLRYCFYCAWKWLISKAVIVKTNGDSELLLFYLIFREERRRLRILFACFVSYSTCLIYMLGWRFILQFLNGEVKSKWQCVTLETLS